jgi:hypothetical protein
MGANVRDLCVIYADVRDMELMHGHAERPERGDLGTLHDRVVGDEANLTVALHDNDIVALRRTQFAQNVQVVIGRRLCGTR